MTAKYCEHCGRLLEACKKDPCRSRRQLAPPKVTRDEAQKAVRNIVAQALRSDLLTIGPVNLDGDNAVSLKTNSGFEFTVTVRPKRSTKKTKTQKS
jgi:hypothetical protein